jgi:hypothetical protein
MTRIEKRFWSKVEMGGDEYGVSKSNVWHILSGRNWTEVEPENPGGA